MRLRNRGATLRLVNLLQLQHNLSVDLYVEKTLRHARLIVLRLLGGAQYWTYGLSRSKRWRAIRISCSPSFRAMPIPTRS